VERWNPRIEHYEQGNHILRYQEYNHYIKGWNSKSKGKRNEPIKGKNGFLIKGIIEPLLDKTIF